MTPSHCKRDNVSLSQIAADNAAIKASDNIKIPTRPGETYCMIRKTSNAVGKKIRAEVKKAIGAALKNASTVGVGLPKYKTAPNAMKPPNKYCKNVT